METKESEIGKNDRKDGQKIDISESHKDSKYSWVVCAAVFLAIFMTMGFSYAIGIYFVVFQDIFEKSSATTSWISSFNHGTTCMTGILYIQQNSSDLGTNAPWL